jgi:flagellar protein FlaH
MKLLYKVLSYSYIMVASDRGYYSIALERDELNRYFGGGIPKNSLILLEGIDGAGKSILCQRLTYALLENGVKITYLSTELNTLDFIKQMDSVKYSITSHMLDKNLLFLTMVPFLGKVKFDDDIDFVDKIIKEKSIFESDVIIFDTMSFLLIKKNDTDEAYFKIVNFFRNLNNLNKIVLFTIDPTHLDEKFLTLLRSVSDLYIQCEVKQFAGEIVRAMMIKRFKRPKDLYMSTIPFRVEPEEGVIIEIGGFS